MQHMIRFMLMFELRQIINDEDPIALVNNTFIDAIRDLCRDANSCGMGTFTLDVQDGFPDLVSELKRSLYRIAQELITNAIKHAQAEIVKITLKHESGHLHLIYSDNGVGLPFIPDKNDPLSIKHGRGIKNIVNRVEKLKGSIEFLSRPNKGLTVSINIPL
jgi:signal transduction histidine kinase